MHRLFFALWPDPETRNKLAVISSKTAIPTSNPVLHTNLHMTIAFLGEVDTGRLEQLSKAAAYISAQQFSLLVDLSGWWEHSQVFWLALGEVPPALQALHASITNLLSACGISVETRPYLPHITLARNVNSRVTVQYEPIHWNVTEFCLLESIPRLGYTEYKIIQCWPLT